MIAYFGTVVDETTVGDLLRTAVEHTPATNHPDLAFDPDAWASGLMDELRGSALEQRAGEVLTEMCRAGSAQQLRFAARLDYGRDLVPPAVVLDALDRATDAPTRRWLAASLARAIRAGRATYNPRMRVVVGEAEVQDELLGIVALHDHAFFLANVDRIFGADVRSTTTRTLDAAVGLNLAELERLRDELAASALAGDVRAAIAAALDLVLGDPAAARLVGAIRW